MKYILLIHGNESVMNTIPVDQTGMSPDYAAYNEALIKAGVMLGGERLRPTTDAATVRITGSGPQVLDGPYAETKEQFGGYYLIDVPDMDTAVSWAVRCPAARHGSIEVRPIWPTGQN